MSGWRFWEVRRAMLAPAWIGVAGSFSGDIAGAVPSGAPADAAGGSGVSMEVCERM